MIRRGKLEHIVTTGMIEGKYSRGKQRKKMFDGLTKWLNEGQVTDAPEVTKDRGSWKFISNVKIR